MRILETQRLYTRKLEKADAEALFDIFSIPEVCRYWSSPAMTDISQAEDFIEETHRGFEDGRLLEWGIIERETDRLIGTCAYASWDKKHRRAEIGFALHRRWWGKGLMKELLSVFIPFGFNELELHRIEADVDPRNIASIKLLEYFGFKKEGCLRERYHLNGELQDAIFYGLLKNEYPGKEKADETFI